jgi:hypothetical protein
VGSSILLGVAILLFCTSIMALLSANLSAMVSTTFQTAYAFMNETSAITNTTTTNTTTNDNYSSNDNNNNNDIGQSLNSTTIPSLLYLRTRLGLLVLISLVLVVSTVVGTLGNLLVRNLSAVS